jgi:superfamily II DNA or RNA helicase
VVDKPKPVQIVVRDRVVLDTAGLAKNVVDAIRRRATYKDPLYAYLKRLGKPTHGVAEPRFRTHRVDGTLLELLRGELGMVVRVLRSANVPLKVVDKRLWLPKIDLPCTITLRDYQREPVASLIKRQQGAVRGPCGTGKTEILLAAAAHFRQPTLVLVWQERQQRVWLERIPQYFGCEVGGIGGVFKSPVVAPIMVGMVQSTRNRLEQVRGMFGCILCDEVHRFAARTLQELVNAMPAAVRLGASDDERRRDGREFLIYSTFGPRAARIASKTGQCPVDIFAVPSRFKYAGRGHLDWPDLVGEITEDDDRNALIVNLAMREVAEGNSVLIWSDRTDHCRMLKAKLTARGITAGLILGHPHQEEANVTEAGLRDGSVQVGIGTSVAEQSLNIRPLVTGIMTCASADKKMLRFSQMRGRLVRPLETGGQKVGRLFYIWDRDVIFLGRKLANIKRRYRVKVLRFDPDQKEGQRMALRKATVTIETLKAGAEMLGLKPKRQATAKQLEKMIQRELAKHKTYGNFACEACGRDIPDESVVPKACPYCAAKYKPFAEPEDDDDDSVDGVDELTGEEMDGDEDEGEEFDDEDFDEGDGDDDEEGEDEEYPHADEVDGDDEDEGDGEGDDDADEDEGEEAPDDDDADFEPEEGEEDPDDEFDPGEDEEDPEPPRRAPKKKTAKKKTAKKKTAKKTAKKRTSQRETERKAADRAARRKQIEEQLPYTNQQLGKMMRKALVMVASVLGIKNPLQLGDDDTLIAAIKKVQAKKFPSARRSKKTTTKRTTKKKTTRRRQS